MNELQDTISLSGGAAVQTSDEKKSRRSELLYQLGVMGIILAFIIALIETAYIAHLYGADKKVSALVSDLTASLSNRVSDEIKTAEPEAVQVLYYNTPGINDNLSEELSASSETLTAVVDSWSIYQDAWYNQQYDLYYLAGDNGNSGIRFVSVDGTPLAAQLSPDTVETLGQVRKVFKAKADKFKTKPTKLDRYYSHVGVKFAKGDSVRFINTRVGAYEFVFPAEVTIEVSKVGFSKGKVWFGAANTFTGNAKQGGDFFIEVDPAVALAKLENAEFASVLVSDVQYWWDKTMNVSAGARYSSSYYTSASGTVDVLDAIGLKADDDTLAARGYVLGGAIIAGQPVSGIRAGGVCFWATSWNTAMRMGLDAYGIEYEVLSQSRHSDPNARYSPGTIYPYVNDDTFFYDVTVAYHPTKGGIGSITRIEEGKRLSIETTILYTDANAGRFLSVTEVKEVK